MEKNNYRKLIILLMSAFFTLLSCNNNAQNRAMEYGNIASVPEGMTFNDTILSVSNVNQRFYKEVPNLVYYFNGDCSVCIEAFFCFFEDWQKLGFVIPAFFIASAPNMDILNYYMERAGLKPQKSLQFLVLDNQDLIRKYNPYMNHVISTIYVLLVDEKNIVIESGNPLSDKNTMLTYKQRDSEYKLTYRVSAIQPQGDSKTPGVLDKIDENDPPLIIIDGKESSLNNLKKVMDKITSWNYVEGPSALILYGNKGANGVLVVNTQ